MALLGLLSMGVLVHGDKAVEGRSPPPGSVPEVPKPELRVSARMWCRSKRVAILHIAHDTHYIIYHGSHPNARLQHC
eukprot:6100677-Alexandrium_andersonii.AAC.1